MFPINNGLKQGDALLPLPLNFALECYLECLGKPGGLEIKWYMSVSSLC